MGHTHYWENIPASADLAKQVRKIIKTSKAKVCGWDGTGKPEVRADKISFDGSYVDGEDYETFHMEDDDLTWQCCKTGKKPYDEVVVASLIAGVVLNETGKAWIDSDGSLADWHDGISLYEKAIAPLTGEQLRTIQDFIQPSGSPSNGALLPVFTA